MTNTAIKRLSSNDALVNGVSREIGLEIRGPAGLSANVVGSSDFSASSTSISFDPSSTGAKSGDLKFTYDGGVEVTEKIALSGKEKTNKKYLSIRRR